MNNSQTIDTLKFLSNNLMISLKCYEKNHKLMNNQYLEIFLFSSFKLLIESRKEPSQGFKLSGFDAKHLLIRRIAKIFIGLNNSKLCPDLAWHTLNV